MNSKNNNVFALRKADRDSRETRRLVATILRLALLSLVLWSYSEWNHQDPAIQAILQRERSLATENASFLFFTFGFLGAALLATLFHQAATAADRLISRPRKATRIR
jgi:hypothetical protein